MIICNRCGYNMNSDSAVNCQGCGAPLSSKAEGVDAPRAAAQEQPGLPAWLETLRVGERPVAPPNSPSTFTAADLIDDSAVPSWMRSDRKGMGDNPPSSPYNALKPSTFPSPNTDEGSFMQRGINAQSLIDEQALPSWMRNGGSSAMPSPQSDMAASNLVESDSAPDWMKNLNQQRSSASKPLPAVPSAYALPPVQSAQPVTPEPAPMPPGQGFSPRDLIDEQSLPSWMTQQNGQRNSAPIPSVRPGQPVQPGTLSPSSLLDMDSIPPWLRQNAQGAGQPGVAMPPAQPQQTWQPQPAQMPPQWQGAPAQPPMQNVQGAGLPGSSFVDPNSLPEWLRSGAIQQQPGGPVPQQGPMGDPRSPGYGGIPPHVENVRVPSRPRGEVGANEGSEVAANVFASMLGVASTAPQFPAPPPNTPYGQPPMPQGMPPAGISGPLRQGAPGFGGLAAPGQGPAAPGTGYPVAGSGNYPTMGSQYPANPAGMPSPAGMPGMPGEQKNTKKRGLVEALRDWLFR
ncbi:MAG: hypothetical protein JOZ18_18585 [Chloroflexi bacterium]|nr:hypothetical protein [Chloroflexota bacterium]